MTNNDDLALKSRIEKALTDFTNGRACMHVPAQETDVDLVLADCLSLLAERDADKEEIATLQSRNRRLEGIISAAEKRIAELEARTVSVKLPRYDLDMSDCDSCGQDCGADMSEEPDGDYVLLADVVAKLAAAGIKLKVEE